MTLPLASSTVEIEWEQPFAYDLTDGAVDVSREVTSVYNQSQTTNSIAMHFLHTALDNSGNAAHCDFDVYIQGTCLQSYHANE